MENSNLSNPPIQNPPIQKPIQNMEVADLG